VLLTVGIILLGCDLLFAVLAIPLILRKVPPNVVYGFRTPTTLGDRVVWYETNAYFGRGLLVSSLVSAVAMFVLYRTGGEADPRLILKCVAALAVPPLVACIAAWRFSRSVRSSMGGTGPAWRVK
jgi:uncharacterized membrane protein